MKVFCAAPAARCCFCIDASLLVFTSPMTSPLALPCQSCCVNGIWPCCSLLCQRGPNLRRPVVDYLLPCGQASHSFGHVFMPNMSAVRWQRRRNDTSFVRTTAARSMSIALDMFLQTFFQQSGLVQQSRPSIYLCQSAHSLNDFEFLGWSHSALVDTVGTLTSQLSELNAIMIFATAHPKDEISMIISPLRPRMPGLCDDNT